LEFLLILEEYKETCGISRFSDKSGKWDCLLRTEERRLNVCKWKSLKALILFGAMVIIIPIAGWEAIEYTSTDDFCLILR